ncbi:MAG TPA: hypothetical protein VG755_06565 [Nannocystaceae bacterium]|nr:hypothetical protein [Nannocystaceae bacterium]
MNAATRTFECLACGSTLEFHAGSVSTHCKLCDDERPLPMRFPANVPATALDATADTPAGVAHVRCGSCGSRFAGRSPPSSCPLCGGVTAAERDGPTLPVHGWLPFLVDEQTATARLVAELQRLRIDATPTRCFGVHLPWLVYQCTATGRYDGRRGDLVGSGQNRRMSWHEVSGVIDRQFENRSKTGSRTILGELADRLEPWDWAFVEPPDATLASQVRECCELTGDGIAARTMSFDAELAAEARADIGGDAQEVNRVDARRDDEAFRQILLPVWIATLTGIQTRVLVNGRTGAVIVPGRREAEIAQRKSSAGRRSAIGIAIAMGLALLAYVIGAS